MRYHKLIFLLCDPVVVMLSFNILILKPSCLRLLRKHNSGYPHIYYNDAVNPVIVEISVGFLLFIVVTLENYEILLTSLDSNHSQKIINLLLHWFSSSGFVRLIQRKPLFWINAINFLWVIDNISKLGFLDFSSASSYNNRILFN